VQILREKAKWKNRKVTPSMLRRLKLLHSPLFQSVYERYRCVHGSNVCMLHPSSSIVRVGTE
jgi:hypothetical protein